MNETHTVIVIGPNCWGRGKDLQEAKKNAKSSAPARRPGTHHKFYGYVAPVDTEISLVDGSLSWPKGQKCFKLGEV